MNKNMLKFGEVKSKMLTKLTESYASGNKTEVKEILKKLKENKALVEMYLFYENIEEKEHFIGSDAKLFVEQLEPMLIEKTKNIKPYYTVINKILGDIDFKKNEVYECLDILSEETDLNNLGEKIRARNLLEEHLLKHVAIKNNEVPNVYTENQALLNAVLVNDFNSKFDDSLNEEEKETFFKIISMKEDELIDEVTKLKDELNNRVDMLLKESKDELIINKLNKAKSIVIESKPTKYNYYKLIELKNGLN